MSTPTTVEHITLQPSVLADLQSVVDRVAKRAPELATRAYRAGILLASGAVRPVRPDLYEVRGSEPRPYAVDLVAETCSCADFQHAAPEHKGAKWCKHRLSVLFLRHLGEKQVARRAERRTRVQVFRPVVSRGDQDCRGCNQEANRRRLGGRRLSPAERTPHTCRPVRVRLVASLSV